MKAFSVSEDIMPLGEFKARASTLLQELAERRRPIVITRNGRPAGVVLSPVAFDRLVERQRLLDSINAGLADIEDGRVMETAELLERLGIRRPGGADE